MVRPQLRDQAEVEDHHAPFARYQYVRRFDIAMELAAAVQRCDTLDELPKGWDHPVGGEAVAILFPRVVDKAHAPDELHRKETPLVLDKQFVETDKVGVSHI